MRVEMHVYMPFISISTIYVGTDLSPTVAPPVRAHFTSSGAAALAAEKKGKNLCCQRLVFIKWIGSMTVLLSAIIGMWILVGWFGKDHTRFGNSETTWITSRHLKCTINTVHIDDCIQSELVVIFH